MNHKLLAKAHGAVNLLGKLQQVGEDILGRLTGHAGGGPYLVAHEGAVELGRLAGDGGREGVLERFRVHDGCRGDAEHDDHGEPSQRSADRRVEPDDGKVLPDDVGPLRRHVDPHAVALKPKLLGSEEPRVQVTGFVQLDALLLCRLRLVRDKRGG